MTRNAYQYEAAVLSEMTKHLDHGWLLLENPLEVIPVGDISGHVLGEVCACGPEYIEDGILVHKAFDGREAYEKRERKLQ